MRVIKLYSPIAWFVALNTSFEGPKIGIKSAQIYPEHLSTSYMGAEADDWPTLKNFLNGRIEGNILNQQALHSAHELVFIIQDDMSTFIQILHP